MFPVLLGSAQQVTEINGVRTMSGPSQTAAALTVGMSIAVVVLLYPWVGRWVIGVRVKIILFHMCQWWSLQSGRQSGVSIGATYLTSHIHRVFRDANEWRHIRGRLGHGSGGAGDATIRK